MTMRLTFDRIVVRLVKMLNNREFSGSVGILTIGEAREPRLMQCG